MLLVGFFVATYNEKRMMIHLANQLYDFEIDDDEEKENLKREKDRLK